MLFMAIVIPTVIEGMMIANRSALVAERKTIAVGFAENLLNEFIITEEWRNGKFSGDFGNRYAGFRWELIRSSWDQEPLALLTVVVNYPVQGRDYYVQLSTVVDEAETMIVETEE
jgi:hypothetical protein